MAATDFLKYQWILKRLDKEGGFAGTGALGLFPAGFLAASAAGRAKIAAGFFDSATVTSLFASGAIALSRLHETGLRYQEVDITSAEIKTLRATPKQLVPAAGAGKWLELIGCVLMYDAGGTAYTITAGGDDLAVRYGSTVGPKASSDGDTAGLLDQAVDVVGVMRGLVVGNFTKTATENVPLVLHNIGANEFTLGNGVLRAKSVFRVHTTGF